MMKKRRRGAPQGAPKQPARRGSAAPAKGHRFAESRGRKGKPESAKGSFTKADDKYKDTPAMSIEERKAAQLAKWRKELGLEGE